MKLADIQCGKKDNPQIDLAKLCGKKILRVEGYLTTEFGQTNFQLTRIQFESGEGLYVEGEHDLPYVTNDGQTKALPDDEVLDALLLEQNGPEESE